MARIYEYIDMDGKKINTLFDSGAIRSYIIFDVIKECKLKTEKLKPPFKVMLGGERLTLRESSFIEAKIQGHPFHLTAYVVKDLGKDEKGDKIELLFGATDMQVWNIKLDLRNEKLDLSRFRKEFVEYYV